jgi:hypothetical protein
MKTEAILEKYISIFCWLLMGVCIVSFVLKEWIMGYFTGLAGAGGLLLQWAFRLYEKP